jgi:elongator complex protein 6
LIESQGIDLAKMSDQGRFAFVDGMTSLFLEPRTKRAVEPQPCPARVLPSRGPPVSTRPPRDAVSADATTDQEQGSASGRYVLRSPSNESFLDLVKKAIAHVKGHDPNSQRQVRLIIDAPDLLLATASTSLPSILSTINPLCQSAHSMVVSIFADRSLVGAATASVLHAEDSDNTNTMPEFSPLEQQQASFVTSLAHRASWVLQLRLLDTGWAKDVSGVLDISKGGGWEEGDVDDDTVTQHKEVLYLVRGDGRVDVFERGSS